MKLYRTNIAERETAFSEVNTADKYKINDKKYFQLYLSSDSRNRMKLNRKYNPYDTYPAPAIHVTDSVKIG
jgi:hypothetical protein